AEIIMSRKGFTLLEVIIAVFFVSMALIAIIEIFNLDFTSIDNIREHLKASAQAQAIMEKVSLTKDFNPANYPLGTVQAALYPDVTLVTVNVTWQTSKSEGVISLVKDFFQ
ncbi:MAG: hypothetical protein KKA19_08135, partial [Candidatus Margulisbacteria bacterium]|nr:hypothetical protein [Candidatus Margulisiibacteriota bacterium]